jgi:hypothetical protein
MPRTQILALRILTISLLTVLTAALAIGTTAIVDGIAAKVTSAAPDIFSRR